MQAATEAGARMPPLPPRVIVGLCLAGVTLLLLVVPGDMILPILVLPAPHVGGCFNPLAGLFMVIVFGLGFLLSLLLIGVGTVGIVLATKRVRGGLITAVLVDAVIATLFLASPLSFTPGEFASSSELMRNGVFYMLFALVPLASAVLLLTPKPYRSSRAFVVTLIVACLLLLPGAGGVTAFAIEVMGSGVHQTQTTPTSSQVAHC